MKDTVLRTALVLFAQRTDPVTAQQIRLRLRWQRPFTLEERQRWLTTLQPWAEAYGFWPTLQATVERTARQG